MKYLGLMTKLTLQCTKDLLESHMDDYRSGTTPCAVMKHCPELNAIGLIGKVLEFVHSTFLYTYLRREFSITLHWVEHFYFIGQLLLISVAMESLSLLC